VLYPSGRHQIRFNGKHRPGPPGPDGQVRRGCRGVGDFRPSADRRAARRAAVLAADGCRAATAATGAAGADPLQRRAPSRPARAGRDGSLPVATHPPTARHPPGPEGRAGGGGGCAPCSFPLPPQMVFWRGCASCARRGVLHRPARRARTSTNFNHQQWVLLHYQYCPALRAWTLIMATMHLSRVDSNTYPHILPLAASARATAAGGICG